MKMQDGDFMEFSVLISVYNNERVDFFKQAIDSILNQTVKPNEIVLVRDGLVYNNLQTAIDDYIQKAPNIFKYIPLDENHGLGYALNVGLKECKYDLVARMDTDDICVPERFERQLKFFQQNPDIDMVGGNISEFSENTETVIDYRCVPNRDNEIKNRLKVRNPFNHQTVMFKKQAVIQVGSYESFYLFEDWYLWIKMALSGCVFANLEEVLCYVRVSDMASRRGGMKYFKSCKKLLKFMYFNKIMTLFEYWKSCFVRFIVYVLCPDRVRKCVYKLFLRKRQL